MNFKGEGVLLTERYRDHGWGLLQVLEGMSTCERESPTAEFAESAARILRERVENAPPGRNEQRWLPGWLSRVGIVSLGGLLFACHANRGEGLPIFRIPHDEHTCARNKLSQKDGRTCQRSLVRYRRVALTAISPIRYRSPRFEEGGRRADLALVLCVYRQRQSPNYSLMVEPFFPHQ